MFFPKFPFKYTTTYQKHPITSIRAKTLVSKFIRTYNNINKYLIELRQDILNNPTWWGGLNYQDLAKFDKVMKETPLRRSIVPYNCKSSEIYPGDKFMDKILNQCDNRFWRDTIEACKNQQLKTGIQLVFN